MSKNKKWLVDFFESWKNLEGEKTVDLFSKDVKYYETPNGEPCKSIEEVYDLWRIVPNNQSNIKYDFSIICEDKDFCIVNWTMTREINGAFQFIDGIFQLSFNSKGLCNFFKQWRYTETK